MLINHILVYCTYIYIKKGEKKAAQQIAFSMLITG